MDAAVREWLDELVTVRESFGGERECRRIERIAELVSVNGGDLSIGGWGFIASGGPYGREGLTQGEAMELLVLNGSLEMVARLHLDCFDEIRREVEALWEARRIPAETPLDSAR